MGLFVIFISKMVQKTYLIYFNLNLPMLQLGTVKVLSVVANVVSKRDCSISEMLRFLIFIMFKEFLQYSFIFFTFTLLHVSHF